MQRILSIILLTIMSLALTSGKNDLLEFKEKKYDFGEITASAGKLTHDFEFTNVSDDAVAVLSVSVNCKCTNTKYPVEPLTPGKTGVISVTFDPSRSEGAFDTNVIVRYRGAKARSSKRVTLRLTGYVHPSEVTQ